MKRKATHTDSGILMYIQAYSNIFKPNQAYSEIIQHNQAYSGPCVNLAYSEPWYIENQRHIQNPGTVTVTVNSGIFKTLRY